MRMDENGLQNEQNSKFGTLRHKAALDINLFLNKRNSFV